MFLRNRFMIVVGLFACAGLTFWATPSDGSRTRFDWVPSRDPGLTFVNTTHDYPQRIRYWREGEFLMAEIALADGSKAKRWRYSARGR